MCRLGVQGCQRGMIPSFMGPCTRDCLPNLSQSQCLSASVGVPLLPGRLHFSVERLVRVSEPRLDPNVVTLPTRCHHHPRWNRAGPDFQQVVPRDTWYLVVLLENRWVLRR